MQTLLMTHIGKDKRAVREDIDTLVERGIPPKDISVVTRRKIVGLDEGMVEFLLMGAGVVAGFFLTMALAPTGLLLDPLFTLVAGLAAGAGIAWLATHPLAAPPPPEEELLLAVNVKDPAKERAARRVLSRREEARVQAVRQALLQAKRRNMRKQAVTA